TKLVGEGIPLHFIKAISLYLYADLLISLVRLLMVFFYVRKHVLKRGVKNNFELGINHIANILHSIILIASVLLLFEIDPINLITSLSIVAAAIAILSKDYISNMINGMIIMFADELTIGDEIKIGDIKGKIVDITLINVHIVNDDEDLIYIPNSIIFSSQIMNFTKRSVRKVSFDFDMKNERLKNIVELEKYITTSLTAYQQYIKEDSYSLKIIKINENFSALKFQFILHKQSSVREKDLRRIALRNVLNYEGK
ncbi:MAG: small-conductance mechanosensitive channel, partial [Marivirga sp.]